MKGFIFMGFSILTELAKGNIIPQAQYFKKDSEYGEALDVVSANEEKLLSKFSGEDKVLLEEYINAQNKVNQLSTVHNMVYGLRLGLLMMGEACFTADELINNERGD
jgi:hypothetical protein